MRPPYTITVALGAALVLLVSVAAHAQPAPGEGSGAPSYDETGRAVEQAAVYIESIEPEEVDLGEPFVVTARIEAPIGWEVVSTRPHGNDRVELLDAETLPPDAEGVVRVRARMVIYRVGRYHVDGLAALLVRPDATQTPALSDPFEINVRSALVNESDPQPAASGPPMQVLTRNLMPLYVGAVLGFALLIALSAWIVARVRRAMEPPVPPPPPRPPWETALERLDALERSGRLERGEHVEFHLELSAALRQFIGGFYGFSAVESTTPEIRAELRRREVEVGTHEDALMPLFSDMDMVKFARFTPASEQSRSMLRATRSVVLDISAGARAAEDARTADEDVPAPPAQEPEMPVPAPPPEEP